MRTQFEFADRVEQVERFLKLYLQEIDESPSYLDLCFYCRISPGRLKWVLMYLVLSSLLRIELGRGNVRNDYVFLEGTCGDVK